MVVFSGSGLWGTALDVTAVVVRVEIGNDDNDGDSMISDEAESEPGTGPERGSSPEIGVAIEVEPPTTVLAIGVFPMLDVCALATRADGTGELVVRSVGSPPWL